MERPQETRHHIDTRWLSFIDPSSSHGLLINADKLIQFNALRNSVEDFDDKSNGERHPQNRNSSGNYKYKSRSHIDDIFPRDFVEINVDFKQQGLAGFNSWEDRVLPQFTIQSDQNHSFGFTIIPIKDEIGINQKINFQYE